MKLVTLDRCLFAIWLLTSASLLLFIGTADRGDRLIAVHTFGLGFAAAAIAVPLGGCLAWVSLGCTWVSRLVLISTLSLLIVPVFLHVSTWDAAFGRLGWLTSTEGQVLVPLVSGWQAASWIHGIAAAPQVAVLIIIGMTVGRRTYEEQALLDTSRLGVFWHVTLKRLWPLLVLSALWTTIMCAREIAATDLYQVGTLAEQVYLGYSLGQINALGGNWSAAELAAAENLNPKLTMICILWLAMTAFLIFVQLTSQELFADHKLPLRNRDIAFRNSQTNVIKSFSGFVLLLILAGIPIGNLIARCCYSVRPIDGVPTASYSLVQLFATLRRAVFDYTSEFCWSAIIAATAATAILCAAVALSWFARRSRMWQLVFVLTLAVSCAIPGPLMGSFITQAFISFDFPLSHWLFDRTICAPVLASIWFCWPLAPLVVWFVFRNIANDALESSTLDGAGQGSQFVRFGIIGNGWALVGCWLISLAFCFGELSASQLVLPPGIDTIPRLMLGLLHAGVDEMTAALTLVSISLIGMISLAGWALIERSRLLRARH